MLYTRFTIDPVHHDLVCLRSIHYHASDGILLSVCFALTLESIVSLCDDTSFVRTGAAAVVHVRRCLAAERCCRDFCLFDEVAGRPR